MRMAAGLMEAMVPSRLMTTMPRSSDVTID